VEGKLSDAVGAVITSINLMMRLVVYDNEGEDAVTWGYCYFLLLLWHVEAIEGCL
jgi:hypothetical protein